MNDCDAPPQLYGLGDAHAVLLHEVEVDVVVEGGDLNFHGRAIIPESRGR